jgi:hypothetical protein
MFADGATSGVPHAIRKSRATACRGIRTPIVGRPPLAISGTFSFLGRTIVNGPGKKYVINSEAGAEIDELSIEICSTEAM